MAVWSAVLTLRLGAMITGRTRRVHMGKQTVVPGCPIDAAGLLAGLPGIGADTVADVLKQSARPRVLGSNVRATFEIVRLAPSEVAAMARTGYHHADSAGLVVLSRVGLGAHGGEALVYFRELSSDGWFIQLKRQKQWIERQLMACPK